MSLETKKTVAVIGAGASGLAAALAAAENPAVRVLLLERQSRAGRKLLVTGNGRCNLTNTHAAPCCYHGENPAFTAAALAAFSPAETLAWFAALGLRTTEEPGGRVYPRTDTAASVLDVLRFAAEAAGVQLQTAAEVLSAAKTAEGFTLRTAEQTLAAHALIIACGGCAGAKAGGVRDGYRLLESFGHSVTELRPALVQIKCDNTWTRALKGVRTQAAVCLERDGAVLSRSAGEVQFTDYGVSGPAVFDLHGAARAAEEACLLALDLLPESSPRETVRYMRAKGERYPAWPAERLTVGLLHNAIGRAVLRRAGLAPDRALASLSEVDLRRVAQAIHRYELPVKGTMGFDSAQVTAGGVRTAEFNPQTMESLRVPGLYACGEVLDIDGICGGYNLQWAWSSGRLAGLAAGGLL